MTNGQQFEVWHTGQVKEKMMVRVVAKIGSNYWLVVSAKEIFAPDHIVIEICDAAYIKGGNYDMIHFELYSYDDSEIQWSYN